MCNRSNNPILGLVFALGSILNLGHVAVAQIKTEYPDPGVYEGSLKFTDGVTTETVPADMIVFNDESIFPGLGDDQRRAQIRTFQKAKELGGNWEWPRAYDCEFWSLEDAQHWRLPDSNIRGPGAGIMGKPDPDHSLMGTVVRTSTGVRISLRIWGLSILGKPRDWTDDVFHPEEGPTTVVYDVYGDLQRSHGSPRPFEAPLPHVWGDLP